MRANPKANLFATVLIASLLPPLLAVHGADPPTPPKATVAEVGETSWEHAPSSYQVPAGMVIGGAFIDRILPMPVLNGLTSTVWGGDNVKPRNADNGLEDPKWSYWCMSVHQAADGKEHMFAARWPESAPKGHMSWSKSQIVHAVADSPTGPFVVKQEVGPGHNVMCYRAKDGTHLLYAIGRAYTSKSLDGPWANYDLQYDLRGSRSVPMTNHTFTQREDGSYLMVSRGGHVWISEDGLKPYQKITIDSAYPSVANARFEDPVVWRDEVQYHLIVNDWFGRAAFYLRSKDGVKWVWDQGKAYDVTVARHPDGTTEKWYKFERPNVRQDALGRATHLYFAVIDSRKDLDLGNDNHSSKIIALPLTVQRRLQVLNIQPITGETREVQLAIKAEEGFDPVTDVDVQSLRFGAPAAVDFGKGCKPLKAETSGKDLTVTFSATDHGFTASDFAGKLLGKNKHGDMLFGYARLPGQTYLEPILRTRAPTLKRQHDGSYEVSLLVENFGQVTSTNTPVKLVCKGNDKTSQTLTATIPAIAPYGSATILMPEALKPQSGYNVDIIIAADGPTPEHLQVRINPDGDNLPTERKKLNR